MLDRLVTSHSIDGTFESCPRRFEFLHGYLSAPAYESDAFAADVGTALHEGTQAWQRAIFNGMAPADAEHFGELTLLRWWPWETEEHKKANGGKIGIRTLGNTLLLLQAIFESDFWGEWELVSIHGYGPAIEVPWRIDHISLGRIRLPYNRECYISTQGKIDFILRSRITGKYRVVDVKSTEKDESLHDAMFHFSGQAGQYGMVLNHALGIDWQAEGLDVTYLIAQFTDDGPIVYPLDYNFDAMELQDSIDVKLDRLMRMKTYADRGNWPRRSHGCEFFGKPCGFLDICSRRDSDYIERWFEFEKASGRYQNYERHYEPVWVLEA